MSRLSSLVLLASYLAIDSTARAQTADVAEFPVPPGSGCFPVGITTGPDGNVWFTCAADLRGSAGQEVGRITPEGVITLFTTPTTGSGPDLIAAGPDGHVWFTELSVDQIARITPAGVITEFPIPPATFDLNRPIGITAGPDGAVWFTELIGNRIGRITPDGGIVTEFSIPTPESRPWVITAGPDGALWFTEARGNNIGRITTDGRITEFPIPTAGARPSSITAGPDGALWFTEIEGNKVGRITTEGAITEFPLPTPGSGLGGIVAGVDGALWFTEWIGNRIGRITTEGAITELPGPFRESVGPSLTVGADGALWFANVQSIGRLRVPIDRLTVRPIRRSRPVQIRTPLNRAYRVGEPSGFWRPGMSSSLVEANPRAQEVLVTEDELTVSLVDGRRVSVPLAWFPRLLHASPAQRSNWQLLGDGEGIHWPDVDEDLSVAGILRGTPAPQKSR